MLMGLAFVGLGASSASPAVATIASTIQSVEGYYPGSLAYTNNNPGNLIYVGQAGATQGAGGFAAFPSYDAGYQALVNQINIYANQGLTINQMMAKYAPAGDGNNNPTAYANTIATALGVSTDTTLTDALAGNATAGVPTVDMSGVFDSIDSTLSDIGTAFSTGSFDSITDADTGMIALALGTLALAAWVLTR